MRRCSWASPALKLNVDSVSDLLRLDARFWQCSSWINHGEYGSSSYGGCGFDQFGLEGCEALTILKLSYLRNAQYALTRCWLRRAKPLEKARRERNESRWWSLLWDLTSILYCKRTIRNVPKIIRIRVWFASQICIRNLHRTPYYFPRSGGTRTYKSIARGLRSTAGLWWIETKTYCMLRTCQNPLSPLSVLV